MRASWLKVAKPHDGLLIPPKSLQLLVLRWDWSLRQLSL